METNQEPIKPASTLTVLTRACELRSLITKVVSDEGLLHPSFKDTLGQTLYRRATAIHELCAYANNLDLYDEEFSAIRKECQRQASGYVIKLMADLKVFYNIGNIDSAKMEILVKKCIEVQRLLKRWIESDGNRKNASLNIIKKDAIETHLFDKGITAGDLFGTKPKANFDDLLRQARDNPSNTLNIHHETGKPFYIPPADNSIPKLEDIPLEKRPKIVKMTMQERFEHIRELNDEICNPKKEKLEMPLIPDSRRIGVISADGKRREGSSGTVEQEQARLKAKEEEANKPVVLLPNGLTPEQEAARPIIIVPAEPIVVPDCTDTPPPPEPEYDPKAPLPPTVTKASGTVEEAFDETPPEIKAQAEQEAKEELEHPYTPEMELAGREKEEQESSSKVEETLTIKEETPATEPPKQPEPVQLTIVEEEDVMQVEQEKDLVLP